MIRLFRFRFIALMAVVACLLAMTACDDDNDVRRPKGGMVKIKLRIDTGKNSPYSRANEPNGFETAEGDYENISTLRILIIHNIQSFNVNGQTQQLGQVEVNKLVTTTPEGQPTVDKLEFTVENDETKRFYLIANEDALPSPSPTAYPTTRRFLDSYAEEGSANVAMLDNWAVSAPHSGSNITGAIFSDIDNGVTFPGIPLTERFNLFISGNPVTISTNDGAGLPSILDAEAVQVNLFLTRAAAKATFSLEVPDDYYGKDIKIDAIRIENLNYNEYVFPRNTEYFPKKYYIDANGDSLVNYVEDGKRYITDFTAYQNDNSYYQVNLPAPFEIKAGNKLSSEEIGTIYFPEAKGDATNRQIKVSVRMDGQWLDAKALGGDGNNILTIGTGSNAVQAIARNTHVDIKIAFGEAGLTWRANVTPYNTVTLNPGFGFPPIPGDPTHPDYVTD